MCRLAAWASRVPTTLEKVLGAAGLARLFHLSTVHSHGWGASWIDRAGTQQLHRSALAAHEDPYFAEFATEVAGTAAVVHLRLATPGYGSGLANVHPFTDDGWAFAHNGALMPATSIGRLQRRDSGRAPVSETDSERYFLSLRDELDRGSDSLAEAMDHVLDRMDEVGLTSSSLNAVLLEPSALRVISCHDPGAKLGSHPVWPIVNGQEDVVWPSYFPLSCTDGPDLLAVVSSGIVDPTPDGPWQIMPNDRVWSIRLADLSSSTEVITRRDDLGGQILRRSA